MFTPITLQYLGEPSRSGGRRSIDREVSIDVVWDETIRISRNQRYHDLGCEVMATILLEDEIQVTDLSSELVKVKHDESGRLFRIVDAIPVPSDIGLEQTYDLLLKQWEEK